jgi:hypothetical protein
MSHAFTDAIKANYPVLHRAARIIEPGNLSPKGRSLFSHTLGTVPLREDHPRLHPLLQTLGLP